MNERPKEHREDLPDFTRKQPGWEHAKEMRKGITAKREAFCREYLRDFSVVKAYERAGYNSKHAETNAYRLFRQPEIQQRVAELKAEIIKEQKLTIEKVCTSLERIAGKAEEDNRFSAAIRSWELLGKYLGMFVERTQMDIRVNQSMEELDQEIERLTKLVKEAEDEGSDTNNTGDA